MTYRSLKHHSNTSFFLFSTVVSPKEAVATKVSPPSHYPANSAPSISPPITSPPPAYPAVLVGRSGGESKAKIPPPVPPRGAQKVKRGDTNGKGALCLRNSLHADVNYSPVSSLYYLNPLTNSPNYLELYPSRKSKTRSFTEICCNNGYYYPVLRSSTSFSDSNDIEYFV